MTIITNTKDVCMCESFYIKQVVTCKKGSSSHCITTDKGSLSPVYQLTKRSASRSSHWTSINKAGKGTIWTMTSQYIRWNVISRSSKRTLGSKSNSIFGHKSFLLEYCQIYQPKSPTMLCFQRELKEEKVYASIRFWNKLKDI